MEIKTYKQIYEEVCNDTLDKTELKIEADKKWISKKEVEQILENVVAIFPNDCNDVKPVNVQHLWNYAFGLKDFLNDIVKDEPEGNG